MMSQRGRHFDPRLIEAFAALQKEIIEIQTEWRDPQDGSASV
jgi:response regulator RpfG family c-di-GMP phosphodiesterase